MTIQQNVPLSQHSTMRLGGNARYMCEIASRQDLLDALAWAEQQRVPVMMIGDGSNIVWQDNGFDGLLLVNRHLRYEVLTEDEYNSYVTVGGGENWDSVVARTVEAGLSGIEGLSLIPGTAGATPVQNVGAYGQQISDVLTAIEAYDTQTKQLVMLDPADCAFGYRSSRFKTTDRGRYLIMALTLHLTHTNPQPPFYAALQKYFDEHGIADFTPAVMREAVIAIRTSKLPDPAVVANTGSFFANPIVGGQAAARLQAAFPGIPCWPGRDDTYKIPAAWLIEQVGLKDYHDQATGMATWKNHALVLVNEHAHTTADLITFRNGIVQAVRDRFGITLEQEPELLP